MEHPITPPPELVRRWINNTNLSQPVICREVATQAARWGADQELDACRKWVDAEFPTYPKCDGPASYRLADARRPKPPSLAKQGCDALDTYIYGNPNHKDKERTYNTIRAALERLKELEQLDD